VTHVTHVRFEILSAVTMRDTIFRDLTPSSPVEFHPRFVETYKCSKQGARGKKEAERIVDSQNGDSDWTPCSPLTLRSDFFRVEDEGRQQDAIFFLLWLLSNLKCWINSCNDSTMSFSSANQYVNRTQIFFAGNSHSSRIRFGYSLTSWYCPQQLFCDTGMFVTYEEDFCILK
jgi:hypothetical protein